MTDSDKIIALKNFLRHRDAVERNTRALGLRLVEQGDINLGLLLIEAGLVHDVSKLSEPELILSMFASMSPELTTAINRHQQINRHHPECWGSINGMPEVYIAEMVCDWKARSEEFGTSLFDFIDGPAAERFGYVKGDRIYGLIIKYAKMLCLNKF